MRELDSDGIGRRIKGYLLGNVVGVCENLVILTIVLPVPAVYDGRIDHLDLVQIRIKMGQPDI